MRAESGIGRSSANALCSPFACPWISGIAYKRGSLSALSFKCSYSAGILQRAAGLTARREGFARPGRIGEYVIKTNPVETEVRSGGRTQYADTDEPGGKAMSLEGGDLTRIDVTVAKRLEARQEDALRHDTLL